MLEITVKGMRYLLETNGQYIRVYNLDLEDVSEITWETCHKYYKGSPTKFLGAMIGLDIAFS